jgi:hypothetical protein
MKDHYIIYEDVVCLTCRLICRTIKTRRKYLLYQADVILLYLFCSKASSIRIWRLREREVTCQTWSSVSGTNASELFLLPIRVIQEVGRIEARGYIGILVPTYKSALIHIPGVQYKSTDPDRLGRSGKPSPTVIVLHIFMV